LFVLLDTFVSRIQLCLCLALLAISHLRVPLIALLVAMVHFPTRRVGLAPFALLDMSVRLPVEFNLVALEDGAILDKLLAAFVKLVSIALSQSIATNYHAQAANTLRRHRQLAHCVRLVVFARSLETSDIHALQAVFPAVVLPTAPFVQLASTLHPRPSLASFAVLGMLVFPPFRVRFPALRGSTVLLGTGNASLVLQAVHALKPHQPPPFVLQGSIHWATAPCVPIVPLASTARRFPLVL
jgi:hypothetical protein